MTPFLIDTHAHIYLSEFSEDRKEMVERALEASVGKIYLPAIDRSTHEAMIQIEKEYPVCQSMMGLHPCSVKEDYAKELELIKDYLQQRAFIAIGEIGLDFYWDTTFSKQQYEAFHQQIELALTYELPICIHSRNATAECIDVVASYHGLKGVFHCFSGNEEQARRLMSLGFYLGIGGVVTFKNSGLDKVLAAVGLTHVLLETDAPYLAPVPYRGKRNEPAYTRLVADKVATVLSLSVEEVARITSGNVEKLFGNTENP